MFTVQITLCKINRTIRTTFRRRWASQSGSYAKVSVALALTICQLASNSDNQNHLPRKPIDGAMGGGSGGDETSECLDA